MEDCEFARDDRIMESACMSIQTYIKEGYRFN